MNDKHPRPESGNGQPPDPDARDADLTALALDQLTADEYQAIQGRLSDDPNSAEHVKQSRSLARLLRDSAPADNCEPSESLRAAVESRLDQLEQPADKVTLPDKRSSVWHRLRWPLAACVVSAMVLIGFSILQPGTFKWASDSVVVAPTTDTQRPSSPHVMFTDSSQSMDEVRVELTELQAKQEKLAGLTDEFNLLLDEQRYAEAERIAKQAQQLDPESEVVRNLLWQSRFVRRMQEQINLSNESGYYAAMKTVESSSVPFHDRLPYQFGDASSWRELAIGGQTELQSAVPGYLPAESLKERQLADHYGYDVPLGWRQVELNWHDGWSELDFGSRANEHYAPIHENKFVVVGPETALSTFSIDVDTASYANMRRFLTHNTLPPPDAVRIEELVNYFQYDYPQPRGRHPFSVNMEVAGCPWQSDHLLLRIGLKGQDIDTGERPASNLVFLLDVSGSMKSENKLPLLKRAMKMLVQQLSENDQVTIVTYAGQAGLKLDTTTGDRRAELEMAIDSLSAGGSTNGSAGIELAYEKAVQHFIEGGTNRVVLATDGDLNVGISDNEQLVQLIERKADSGVFLTVLGFGTGNLKDAKLEKLADHGNGMYGYIDSMREARKLLVEQMAGSLVTIAKDVKLQLEFNPAEVRSYRLIGYENRVMAAQDFADDTKDAGEIGAGHTVTALYELEPTGKRLAARPKSSPAHKTRLKYQQTPEPEVAASELTEAAGTGELLTLSLRYKPPEGNESSLIEVPLEAQDQPFAAASDDFRFTSTVAAFGMLLRGSQHCGDISFATVEEWASNALGEDPHGRRSELVDLVRRAKQLRDK